VLHSEGGSQADIAGQLGVADWQARKLLEQARHQSPERLIWALERILAADEAIKTGKCSDREAMDILLAELSRPEG
jgi:DNA polymerase-3 subunit delta